ncbi:pentapeptide repeat-containing protein [Aliarcobacter butzleri]|uniref:Pentapeptide repeat-containing protein n=1 Tax=Aliarcobacter butzleri TaxID=28197 RepID=A0AAW6VE01_9BACT|nr:pentapeptide repeat-containing protein [Aliarcobacter butzleri]MDK2040358.1 pentapeptide repeat-containing protein [Aliarcobacter butzleri]MDK2095914.1 pentapeptide repeat-containing protein [Aliarcobacter butzleri]
MSKCCCGNCTLEVFENSDKCILHCEKYDWYEEYESKNPKYFDNTCPKNNWNLSKEKINNFWKIFNNSLKENIEKNVLECTYTDMVFPALGNANYPKVRITEMKFLSLKNCIFLDAIDLSFFLSAKNLEMEYCIFNEDVKVKEVIHKEKFLFQNNLVLKNITFDNIQFEGTSSFMKSTFKNELTFQNLRFDDLALFNNCQIENLFFRNIFFRKESNFLDMTLLKVGSRETARIIKDSFEKQNNIIEANKFYALEMKEREKELEEDIKEGKNFFEWLVFKIHGLSSNHSQDWLLALFWIISFTLLSVTIEKIFSSHIGLSDKCVVSFLIFSMIVISNIYLANSKKVYYLIFIAIYFFIYLIFTEDFYLKCFSKTLNPFSLMQANDPINGIELLYKIIIAYLIYQLIISIRQNTRRK